jgi:hypothetical protein
MIGPVAVLSLVGVAAAGNDVHRQTAAAQLVERRQLAGGDRRRHKAGPMRQEETQPLGYRGRMRSNQKPVGRLREVADEYAVKAGLLMDLGRLGTHLGIKRRSRWRDQLGRDPRRDPTDHLHWHSNIFPSCSRW